LIYADAYALDIKYLEEALKKLLFLLVVMILALVAFPVIASESIGPPGLIVATEAPNIPAPAVMRNEAVKETTTIDLYSILVRIGGPLFAIAASFAAFSIGYSMYSITHKNEHGTTTNVETSGVA
jgi:hypothetical protein